MVGVETRQVGGWEMVGVVIAVWGWDVTGPGWELLWDCWGKVLVPSSTFTSFLALLRHSRHAKWQRKKTVEQKIWKQKKYSFL